MRKSISLLGIALGLIIGVEARAQTLPPPIHVPLSVTRTASGTYKATTNVGIGGLQQQIPFGFDTGSTGLHVFADVTFTGRESGVRCTNISTHVTYGNPPREEFFGVICHATLHIGAATTPAPVAFAYPTKVVCLANAPLIGGPEATSVIAGTEFSNSIADIPVPGGRVMTNTGIQVFFHHVVTYDAEVGAIFFAPAGTSPD